MFESRPGVVCVGEAAVAVDVGRGVTVEAELSTDGGMDSFLLFEPWERDSVEGMLGRQRL